MLMQLTTFHAARLLAAAFTLALACAPAAVAEPAPGARTIGEPKLIIVTFDGVRWQEIFRGADEKIAKDEKYVAKDWFEDGVDKPYLKPANRPAALAPFLHEVVATQGVLIGNRDAGECARQPWRLCTGDRAVPRSDRGLRRRTR
jgi:hypothetical protein